MTDFAMPQALELEASRRNGIPAVRREVVHNTTTQNEYRPGELCYIPIDTGAAGAFMDTTTTRLEMTIVVRNKNYFVDFINLPRCGWNAIIQEFGVEINNGLHELNRHYAECIELDMIKRGENRTPYQICRSNPWRPAGGTAGQSHINFIKPSMVTSVALPHNVKYAPLTTSTAATTPDIIQYGMLLDSNPFTSFMFGRINGTTITDISVDDYITYDTDIGGFRSTNGDVSQSFWDDRIPESANLQIRIDDTATFVAEQSKDGITEGSVMNINSHCRIVGGPTYGTDVGHQAWTSPHDMYGGNAINIYSAVYGQSVVGASPGQWPAFQPCPYDILQKQIKDDLRLVNADNIQNYYANCKNIPIGIALDISSDQSGYASIYGDSVKTKPSWSNPEFGSETEFQVSLKVYSSLIGELTKKWFPELVVPQGRMRLRLRFQEPQIVFQTLMDPCRRVPGTSRDFLPYMGIAESSETTSTAKTMKHINQLTSCSVEELASGIHPIMVRNYSPGMCFIPAVAMGKFPLPLARMKNLLNLTKITDTYDYGTGFTGQFSTAARYVAEDDLEHQKSALSVPNFIKFIDDCTSNIATTPDILGNVLNYVSRQNYNNRVNQEIGYSWFYHPLHNLSSAGYKARSTTDTSVQVQDCQQLSHPPSYRTLMKRGQHPVEGGSAEVAYCTEVDSVGNEFWRSDANSLRDRPWKGQNWYNFCIPTPQYIPIVDPWSKLSTRIISADSYLNENQLCFGTHLEASVAQVRRSHSTLYPLQISDKISSRLDERLTYVVRNVQLVTQQIILPRTAAISIVENALNGGISMETIAWKEMESMLPKAESQKHLINMAAAFANSLTFVFRPIDTYQGDQAFGHNSFSFYNPFTVFYYEHDPLLTPAGPTDSNRPDDYNYLGGKPVYYNECIISTRVPFDIQLQLSSELYPRTPIDTIHRLLMHTRWGDQVFSNQDYMELAPCLQPSYLTQKGMVINTLQDGFWACYTPISALDDQTITCNPYFVPLELSIRKRIRGKRAPKNALPHYKPFDGTFHLSFNLEAFMGQSGRMRTGVPVVNNNMFLKMEKAHLIRSYDTQLLTICECDAKVVFERGGTMQFFT